MRLRPSRRGALRLDAGDHPRDLRRRERAARAGHVALSRELAQIYLTKQDTKRAPR